MLIGHVTSIGLGYRLRHHQRPKEIYLSPRNTPERDRDINAAAALSGVHSLVRAYRHSMWLRWLVLSASLAAMMDLGWAQNVTYRYKVKRAPFIFEVHELWRQHITLYQRHQRCLLVAAHGQRWSWHSKVFTSMTQARSSQMHVHRGTGLL